MDSDEDDDLTYVSASDSEFEAEALTARSRSSCSLASRASSTRRHRRPAPKRPAPQPPTISPRPPAAEKAAPMTSFVREFNRVKKAATEGPKVSEGPAFFSSLDQPPLLTAEGAAAFKPPDQSFTVEGGAAFRPPDQPSSTATPSEGAPPEPGKCVSNLQLQLITYPDASSPLPSYTLSPHASPTPSHALSSPESPTPSYAHPHGFALPSVSPFYSELRRLREPTSPEGASYFAHPAFAARFAAPGFPDHAYAPVTFVQQQHFSAPAASRSGGFAPWASSEGKSFCSPTIAHSASEPNVHRVVRSSSLSLPMPLGPALDRLSEGEETVDDGVYEEVLVGGGAPPQQKGEATGRRRRRRSDSVSVPHLYEDLLVSSRLNLRLTFTSVTMAVVAVAFLLPNTATLIYTFFRLIFGTLFPAYYSYKAVRTKNVKEYVKWMMYWIVFAFFTCAETITDVFLSFWFPFYYEIKILVVLWLLSPATRGSSILYRKFVHPWLTKKEEEIDECIAKAKQQGYSTVVQLGTKGVNYATTVIMQTAIKGGGGLVSQLKRSYSASEIGEDAGDFNRNVKPLPKAAAAVKDEPRATPSEDEDIMMVSSGQTAIRSRRSLRSRRPPEKLNIDQL